MKIYTGTQASEIDHMATTHYGYTDFELMVLAGKLAFQTIMHQYSAVKSELQSMIVLCGGGNNGGDGYVVARLAKQYGWPVTALCLAIPKKESALKAYKQYQGLGGKFIDIDDFLQRDVTEALVVDALLGIGLNRPPKESYARVIEHANLSKRIVAVDVPSGVNANSGEVFFPHICANFTITFIVHKLGLLTGAGAGKVGKLTLEGLSIKDEVKNKVPCVAHLVDVPKFSARNQDSHKGEYGHVIFAGGDDGMLGAILLAGQAALRCGSGKVHCLSTTKHLDQPALFCPELMSAVYEENNTLLGQCDVLAVGPGLGQGLWGKSVFINICDHAITEKKPLVVDADALNLLAKAPIKYADWVLTPHPAEAARLLNCTTAEIQSDRLSAVNSITKLYGGVCVLKGAGTLVCDETGKVALCDKGNAGMATAGMGDVLTGMIASFIGQGMPLREAAESGAWLHAYVADKIVEGSSQRGLIASDIVQQLPASIGEFEP